MVLTRSNKIFPKFTVLSDDSSSDSDSDGYIPSRYPTNNICRTYLENHFGVSTQDKIDAGPSTKFSENYSSNTFAGMVQFSRSLVQSRATLTLEGKRRQRMKWTKELNVSLMNAYYKATKLETKM